MREGGRKGGRKGGRRGGWEDEEEAAWEGFDYVDEETWAS